MFDHDKRRYVGMTSEQAEVIDKQNKFRADIEWLKSYEFWDDIEPLKAQMIVDILNDEFKCPSCENKNEQIENLTENFRDYNQQVEDQIISSVEFHVEEGLETEKEEIEYHLSRIKEIVGKDYKDIVKNYRNYLPER